MKKGEFIDGMKNIDPSMLEEAENYTAFASKNNGKKPKKSLKALLISAAALVLSAGCIIGGVMISKNSGPNTEEIPDGIKLSGSAYYTDGVTELPEALKSINVTADGASSRIISPNASFYITTAGQTDPDTLVQYLSLSPSTPVSVKQNSSTEFVISPASGSFASGTVYKLKLGDPENPASSYVFQTESEFVIKSQIPADKGLDVPVSSGIEITFSETIESTANISRYFSISPSVKGEWMLYQDGRTVVFVPEKDLQLNTVYEYTVKAGLSSASGRKLKKDVTAKFKTADKEYSYENGYIRMYADASFRNLEAVFGTSTEPYIKVYISGSNLSSDISYSCKVYKYKSFSDAYNAIKKYESTKGTENPSYSTSGLEYITDYSGKVSKNTNRSYTSAESDINLPSNLQTGVYLLKLEAKATGKNLKSLSCNTDLFIQVSDLRSYTVSSDGKTVIGVYDTSKGFVNNATITGEKYTPFDGWNSKTDEFTSIKAVNKSNGIYEIETGNDNCLLLHIKSADGELLTCQTTANTDVGNYTMKYIFTDREMYFANDKVNFWGFITPAYENSTLPERLYLKRSDSSLRTPIEIGNDGSFEGSIILDSVNAYGIYITLTDEDGGIVTSKYIQVTQQEKPQITASISFDKLFYRYGETVNVTVSASFFDGTPVDGVRFDVSCDPFSTNKNTLTTDSTGKAEFSIKTGKYTEAKSTSPVYINVYAQLSGFETQSLYLSESVLYFHSDYVFETHYEPNRRYLTLNNRDTSKLKTEADLHYPAFPDNTIGTPAAGKVSYTLIKYVITKHTETKYDTYTKRRYESVRYSTSETTKKSGILEFKDGIIDLPLYEVVGFTGGYYYEISYYDGRNTYCYLISAVANSRTAKPDYTNNSLKIELNKEYYSVNDSIKAGLYKNQDKFSNVFWVLSANGIYSYSVGSEFTETYKDCMIPGSCLYGIYYNENTDRLSVVSADLSYDYTANAEMKINIKADKETYKPGETATVKISATVGNKPVTSGNVLICVVDEACFALCEQSVSAAKTFFNSLGKATVSGSYNRFNARVDYIEEVSYNSVYSYGYYYGIGSSGQKEVYLNNSRSVTSYYSDSDTNESRYYSDGGAIQKAEAEKVQEAADAETESSTHIREYFADNPVFATVEIGADGTATYVFTVPDNITSWRITACGISGSGSPAAIKTGNGVSDIICTQSFFISPGVCSRYIYGDDISISARSYGSAADGKVSYTATLYDISGNEIKKITATEKAEKQAWVNFGKLECGTYSAVIYAKCGDYTDAMRVSFEVIQTASAVNVSENITPEQLSALSPLSFPVTLTFHSSNGGYSNINSIIYRLAYKNDAGRADMIAAKYAALSAYEKIYGNSLNEDSSLLKKKFSDYISENLIRLLRYSSADAELTARILAVCPEILTDSQKSLLCTGLYQEISNGSTIDDVRLCSALLGLAALEEPVLDRLYFVTSQAKNYSLEAKLYLCAAFATIGDYSAASELWTMLKNEFGVSDTEYDTLYIKADNLQERIRYTSLALIATSRFNKGDAGMLANYLLGNGTRDEASELALASYIRYFMPAKTENKTLTLVYSIGGKKETVEINLNKSFTLNLIKSEFETFKIESIDDGILIHAAYSTTADKAYENKIDSSRVKIEKSITPQSNGIYTVSLTISGKSTRVYESFEISDWIPSGARFYKTTYNYSASNEINGIRTYGYIYNAVNQQMSGYIGVYNRMYAEQHKQYDNETTCPEYEFSITVTYSIRGAVAGEFVIEPAIVSNTYTNIYSMSKRQMLTISDPSSNSWKIK